MAIITPPDELALQIGSWQLGQQRYDITEQSDGNGHTATRLGAPPRWRLRMGSVPALLAADAARWKATALALRGRINHLAMWDVTNPVPRGTLRAPSVLLLSAAATGATSVSLSAAWTSNPVLAPQGLSAAVWIKQGCTVQEDLAVAPDGSTTADGIVEGTGDGSGSGHGVRQNLTLPAGTYALSWFVYPIERNRCSMWAFGGSIADTSPAIYDNDSGGSAVGTGSPTISAAVGGWRRCTRLITVPSASSFWIHIGPQDASTDQAYVGDGSSRIMVWGIQLQPGATVTDYTGPATLLMGDMLQIDAGVGSHYCMVTATAAANDAGHMTVGIEPPLRRAFISGCSVTWDKPVAHYKLTTDSQAWQGVAGSSDVGGFTLDLLEDWRP